MQYNYSTGTTTEGSDSNRVQVILLQNWATMVDELGRSLQRARAQNGHLELRMRRMHRDAIERDGLLDEALADLHSQELTTLGLSELLARIYREHPNLQPIYETRHNDTIAGFSMENPIDLTTEEELDDEF